MCGRFRLTADPEWMEEAFALEETPPPLPPRYNVAPGQDVAAVRVDPRTHGRRLALLRWGLVPSWAVDVAVGNRLVNARAESVASRPAFAEAFRQRRCLLPATGFYEWRKRGSDRQPYLVAFADGTPFALAGLWEEWRGPQGALRSCAVITTTANELVGRLHGRMPVIVDRRHFGDWLDHRASAVRLSALLAPHPAAGMVAYPVSRRVNRPDADDPSCAEPIDPGPEPPPAPVQKSLF